MNRAPRIRIRWLDPCVLWSPRYVVDGAIVHREPSRRIRSIASRDAKAAYLKRGPRRRRHCLAIILSVLTMSLACGIVMLLMQAAINMVSVWLDETTALDRSNLLFVVTLAVLFLPLAVAFVPAFIVLSRIWMWAMQPHFRRGLEEVAKETCLFCNYDLRGHSLTDRCPECGAARLLAKAGEP